MASKTGNKVSNEELFLEYQKTKSVDLRNELVEKYLYLVDILIKRYLNKGVDYDDLYQVGSMALVYAVERFDVEKGFEFSSFATPTIIGEIKRYFRDKGWAMKVPRRLKEISSQIATAKNELFGQLHRTPTVKEIAKYMGYTEDEILEAMESGQAYGTFSLDQPYDESDDSGEAATMDKFTGTEDRGFENFETSEIIKKVFESLNEKEREIFQKRFMEDETQQDIAKALDISQMTVSRLEKSIKEKFKQEYYR